MNKIDREKKKYFRYVVYLILSSDFVLPPGLPSALEIAKERAEGRKFDNLIREFFDSYDKYISTDCYSVLTSKMAKSVILSTYATCDEPENINQLYQWIDALDSIFWGLQTFDKFEC